MKGYTLMSASALAFTNESNLIARQVDLRENINAMLVELARQNDQRPGDFLEQLVQEVVTERAKELKLNGHHR